MKVLACLLVLAVMQLGADGQRSTRCPVASCICTNEFSPVCTTANCTYSNRCRSTCVRQTVAYNGECRR